MGAIKYAHCTMAVTRIARIILMYFNNPVVYKRVLMTLQTDTNLFNVCDEYFDCLEFLLGFYQPDKLI